MKHLIASLLMLFTPNTRAGWFFDNPPPDLGPEYRAKLISLEDRISEQHASTTLWEIAAGTLAVGCVLLFVIRTALGAKTRQHYDGTTRMGRTVPTNTPPTPNGARHHMGEQVHQIVIRRWQPEPLSEPVVETTCPT